MKPFYDKEVLLKLVKSNNVMELLPLLSNCKEDDFKMSPSEFIKEMTLTSEERYKKLTSRNLAFKPQGANSCSTDFSVFPSCLVFQSFQASKTYTLQLQIRNCRKVLMPLKMICPKSYYFRANFVGTPIMKVAPGLSVDYEIAFTPSETKDYWHHIIFKTENDEFYVPIIAIGPRPLLDLPDEIIVPPVPVKIQRTKVVLLRNIGSMPAGFKFISRGPFRVEPAKGYLNVKEFQQLSIIFESSVSGSYSETLQLHLETGEILSIQLYGSAENVSVRLSKTMIVHDDTFMGMGRSKIFYIQNNSQSLVKYSWKRNRTLREDLDIIERMTEKYKAIKELEVIKDVKQDFLKLCSHKSHELAWERITQDEIRLLENEEFRFQHPVFKMEPESGEIFPKASVEIITFFEPNTCGEICAEAYLEISGREERLPLQMKGNGLGPRIIFNLEILDIDYIFLCSVHRYEIVALNKGHIPGTISFIPEPLLFGGKVEVQPCSRRLMPDEQAVLILSFTSNRNGDFTEKLNFVVSESKETISIVLKGKIVSPTLHFDRNVIDFGIVPVAAVQFNNSNTDSVPKSKSRFSTGVSDAGFSSTKNNFIGFPTMKEVTLKNLSTVPVTFSLRILSDGTQPSISYEKFSRLQIKPQLPKSPKEFQIDPVEGVVEPFSNRTVVLTLTANISRRWVTHLVVDMWYSENESVSCPVRFNAQIPSLRVEPNLISIPFCFINLPYTRTVIIRNGSRIPGFYHIAPHFSEEPDTLSYSANVPEGVIEPMGTTKVVLTISTNALGRQSAPLSVLAFGSEIPFDVCSIACVGQGPVVTVTPNSLHWGEVQLLQESQKILTVLNEYPIPATFTITFAKNNSPWTVNISRYTLAPEERINLQVHLLLRDRGKYEDLLKITVENGKSFNIDVSAIGIGNSLLMEPDISGKFDLGTLFSHKKYIFDILLKNAGSKTVSLIWCPIEDYRSYVAMKFVNPLDTIFNITPSKLQLPGGCSEAIQLEVYCNDSGLFKQKYYCHANFETSSKELYLTSELSAVFTEALVSFDKLDIFLYRNTGPDGVEEKLTDYVNVSNKSVVPISLTVTVKHPFYLENASGQYSSKIDTDLAGNDNWKLKIFFKPEDNENRVCCIFKDKVIMSFKENTKKLSLNITGEVNYPNIIILPSYIDFGCIPSGTSAYREFIIVNVSPVAVNFEFSWDPKFSSVTHVDSEPHSENSIMEYGDNSNSDYREILCEEDNWREGEEGIKNYTLNEENELFNKTECFEKQKKAEPPMKPILEIPDVVVRETDVKGIVFPIVQKYYTYNEDLINAYEVARSSATEKDPPKPAFSQYFDITPFYGHLEKFESQVISISFRSDTEMEAHCEASVRVEAGPNEVLYIDVKAANLHFRLNKYSINFGKQVANEYIKIINMSDLAFDYETSTKEVILADNNNDVPMESGMLVISPRYGHVPPESEKLLRIKYHPGIPGKFEEKFELRAWYLDPIIIEVNGFAVFPQVHFTLPRFGISSLPTKICYAAVASITPDWFLTASLNRYPSDGSSLDKSEHFFQSEFYKDGLSDFDDESSLSNSWTVISKSVRLCSGTVCNGQVQSIPSNTDIELAIERILVYELLSNVSENKPNIKVYTKTIPNFVVPAYELDFGVVVIGHIVQKTFQIINYGPLTVVFYLPRDRFHGNHGMNIAINGRTELKVGDKSDIIFQFYPKRNNFTERYKRIENTFHFEVHHGAKIPVKASAIVTYPFVTPSAKSLNFGEVKCGTCKIMSFKMKNFGWITATWLLAFQVTSKDVGFMHQSGLIDGRTVFHLSSNKGTLHPNDSCFIQISFRPDFGGKFLATLIIKVEGGFDEYKITLAGEGIESRLKITEININFEPTLPYPKKFYKCFTIENPCPFPVEFYFADTDEQILVEDSILRLLMAYYDTKELLLPLRNPGDKLPKELFKFYDIMLENLKFKFFEKMKDKKVHEVISPATIYSEDSITQQTNERKKKGRRSLSTGRPRSSMMVMSNAQHSRSNTQVEPSDISVFGEKTAEEIEELLIEFAREYSVNELRWDPVGSAIDADGPLKTSDILDAAEGLVIIIHAPPRMNAKKLAKLCGRAIERPLMNIDDIILEEMVLNRCNEGIMLRRIIENSYSEYFGESALNETQINVSEIAEPLVLERQKEMSFNEVYQEVKRKVYELFALRDEMQTKIRTFSLTDEKPGTTGSAKKKGSTPIVKTIQQSSPIPEGLDELITEILRYRIKSDAQGGVLFENLNSKWIDNHVSALKILIRACGNMSDILVISLFTASENYKQMSLQEELDEERIKMLQREEALRVLEEEPEEKFADVDLPEDEKDEIVLKFLKGRHEEYNYYRKCAEERAYNRNIKTKDSTNPLANMTPKPAACVQRKDTDKSTLGSSRREKEKHYKEESFSNALDYLSKNGPNSVISEKREKTSDDILNSYFIEQLLEIINFLENWDRSLGMVVGDSLLNWGKSVTPRRSLKMSLQALPETKTSAELGVPLWLIDLSSADASLLECVCQYLLQKLRIRQTAVECDTWASDTPDSMTFSFYTMPPQRNQGLGPPEFSILPVEKSACGAPADNQVDNVDRDVPSVEKLEGSESQISLQSKKKSIDTIKGRITESRTSVTSRVGRYKKSVHSCIMEDQPVKSRWILQESELTNWLVKFSPKQLGKFERYFAINLVTSHNNYLVKCTGICDIPRLDMNPENVFTNVSSEKLQDSFHPPTFFVSCYCFDFGPIVPKQQKEEGHEGDQHAIFSLTNVSFLPVELRVVFADDALKEDPTGYHNFSIEPNTAYLKPNQTLLLNVYANPMKYGNIEEVLMLFVKGNPKIETIRIRCTGVKINLTMEPRVIDFDRLLLYRKDKRKISLTNNNLIPLYISLAGVTKLPPQFSFSTLTSWIEPLTTLTLDIEYRAEEIQVISGEVIQIQVYSRTDNSEPVQTLNLTISAEAYDASVDIFFSTREENHVDFEDIRVESEYKKSVFLKNTGKYTLGFKIDIDHALLETDGKEEFYVSPADGKLPVGKIVNLNVHLTAKSEVNWKHLPLFKITLTEPYNNDELVASIPMEVSARSFFSRFTVLPDAELNIGPVLVGSQKSVSISIQNEGHFSVLYSIEHVVEESNIEAEIDLYKKSSKRTSEASSKEKSKKSIPLSIKIGSFELEPSSGTIEVKEVQLINVTFSPTEVKQYEEVIIIHIDEDATSLSKGNELKILAEGCIPQLDFRNFTSIFREHHVKQNNYDLPLVQDIGYQTIFTIDENQFCFKNVCLGKTAEAKIHLENKGQIDCYVTSSVSKPEGKRSRISIEPENDHFWVKPSDIIIPPYDSKEFIIYFQPEMLQNYKGQVTLNLIMPEKYKFVMYTFDLFGTVCTPEIEIIKPLLRTTDGQGLVYFPPTTPARTSTSVISFKNTGKIESKVILEICDCEKGIFTLTPNSYTESMLKAWELSKPIDSTTLVTILPGQTAEFSVLFKPLEIKKYFCDLKLFVVDNGFLNLCYKFAGEAVLEEVILEKIVTNTPFAEPCASESSSYSQGTPGHYFLDLGHCFINKKKKFLARLSNKTEKDYFKFEWNELQGHFTIEPAMGHLYPGTYKEILFVFTPQESIEIDETPLTCSLKKIHFNDGPPGPSWDSRLVQYQTIPLKEMECLSSKSVIRASSRQESVQMNEIQVSGHEPDYEVIPESNTELILHISAVADYARLYCETKNIDFMDTFMFQSRSYTVVLENIGTVACDYSVELINVTYEPLKFDVALQTNFKSLLKLKRPSSMSRTNTESNIMQKTVQPKKPTSASSKPRPLGNEKMLHVNLCESHLSELTAVKSEIKDEMYNPFQLENMKGTVHPNEKAMCKVVFSPLDVKEYKGTIKINVYNIHPDQKLSDITVHARSVMPYCHFDIPESDYIESGRRDYSKPGPVGSGPGVPLDPQIKAIEIKIIGIRVTKPILFYAINPTEDDYDFVWSNVTQNQPGMVQTLYCNCMEGSIQAGRQKLMEFIFVSQQPGIFEYFWKFSILQYQIEMVFLFVIVVEEPMIYFLPNNLIMRPTSIGAAVTDTITLINQDDVVSNFYFIPDSLYSEGRLNSIKVHPLSGKIDAKSEMKFRLTFVGKTNGKTVFNLKCKLKKLQKPIQIIVETITYSVEPLVTYEDLSKTKHTANPSTENDIDFGKDMQTELAESIVFHLTSTSQLPFYFEWAYNKKELIKMNCIINFSQTEGQVAAFSRIECYLTVVFTKKSNLTKFPIKLKINKGPTYIFLLTASASSPLYEFSFSNYDFGYCYPQTTEVTSYETNLIFKNKDKIDILLENLTCGLKNFTCEFNETVLSPGHELSIPIKFYPQNVIKYEEKLVFKIATLFEKSILLSGQGTDFKVALADIANSNVHLGAVRVGNKHSERFSIVNKGLACARILIGFAEQLPVDPTYLIYSDQEIDLSQDERFLAGLNVVPSKPFTIRPKEQYIMEVKYEPIKRTSYFTETLCMQFQDTVYPLCVITGSSVGPEFSLDRKYITFGAVVANCSTSSKLRLINSGDIGAKFKWETEGLEEYSISPAAGYVSAESEVVIQVNFHPKRVRSFIKKTVECRLSVSDVQSHPPLILKLNGDCVDIPEPVQSIFFECHVREFDSNTIEIINRTGNDWRLLPHFSGDYFDGSNIIFVPSMASVEYEISYCPMTMTKPDNVHKGSLFFCLPDGTGQLYDLTGTSLPPGPSDVIEREVPCKTKYTELLKIRNWLRSHQRFKVTTVCTTSDSSEDPVFTCSGCDQFELAASAEKEYKLGFFSYKVGRLRFRVTFTNEETKEYVWFDILFNVVMCGPLEVITLKAIVRQLRPYSIKLENPLTTPIQYRIECSSQEVLIPAIDIVPPGVIKMVEITYRPIHPGEKTEQLKVTCQELGVFPMELHLIAVEQSTYDCLKFETPLGSNEVQKLNIPNYSTSHAILNCRVTSDEFKVDERLTVGAQDSAVIDVVFEPSDLGTTTANLYVESEQAGNFKYSLIGTSVKPAVKGPFVLKSGSGINITFKNVLKESKLFQIYVDNPVFMIKSDQEEIPSGAEIKIYVSLQKFKNLEGLSVTREPGINMTVPVMGQLVIECYNPNIKWQYYLKGVVERASTSKN